MESPVVAIFVLLLLAAYLTYRLLKLQNGRDIYEAKCQQKIMEMQVAWGAASAAHELRISGKLEEMRTRLLEMQRERARKDAEAEQWRQTFEAALRTRARF